jgi:Cu(I)/Ag(I) efflux system membrane fusion protein
MTSRARVGLLVFIVGAVAFGVGLVISHEHAASPDGATEAVKYQCPMHPEVIRDEPGVCPICGMKLVKMKPATTTPRAPTGVAGLASIEIDARRQQLIGLHTAKVDRGVVGAAIRTSARVSVDETRVRRVNVKAAGYGEKIFVDFAGKAVRRGQPLFSLYSPDVLAAENEYLAALKAQAPGLAAGARRKLELWDVPASELERIAREGTVSRTVTFFSPVNGVVTKKDVVEGARLEAGAMPYEVVDLSTVWVLADVYEPELRFVAPGAMAHLTLAAFPGADFEGKVLFVDPVLDPATRTARARLEVANPRGELRPEMFGEAVIERPPREVLRVPGDALIHSGTQDVVFLASGDGHFTPRVVRVGESSRAYAEILDGVTEGELVVTHATFLVDSESRLRASLEGLSGAPP